MKDMVFCDFTQQDNYMNTTRMKFYNNPKFKEMIESLNIEVSIISDRVILSGSNKSLQQVENAFDEFKRNEMQPGKNDASFNVFVNDELKKDEIDILDTDSLVKSIDQSLNEKLKMYEEQTNDEIKQEQEAQQVMFNKLSKEQQASYLKQKKIEAQKAEDELDDILNRRRKY